jgi:hypothetical protein
MIERVAGPGELTCVDENCTVSGLRQDEGGADCPRCGTSLARMPGAVAAQKVAPGPGPGPGLGLGHTAPARSSTSWQSRPLAFRVGAAIVGVLVIWLVSFVIRNPDALHRLTGPEFSVGDCVTVGYAGLSGSDMKKATCGDSPSLGDPVYQVTQVRKGKDGRCPETTFSNEPENTTYCLTMRY